jgi:hypothetical protein
MRVFLCRFALFVLVASQAFSQTVKRVCPAAGTVVLTAEFDDSYESATLAYQLSEPKAFSKAQIEVWDRPKLLFRAQVPVQGRGQIVWKPKEEPADTPYALWIQVDDPKFRSDGSESSAMVGTTGPVEGGPVPELVTQSIVLEEGEESHTVLLKGKNFSEHNTRILLQEEESPQVWIAREYLPAVLADLEHVSIEIPSGYLLKPTVLNLAAVRVGDESEDVLGRQAGVGWRSVTVHVMSKDRPVFSSIEPSRVSAGQEAGAAVRILGSGFTSESQVLVSEGGGIDFSSALKPVFISSDELQVTVRDDQLRTGSAPDADFQLWVRNDDEHISAPQTLTLMPTPEFPLAGMRRPLIVSVSPYPISLMDQRSSPDLLLKIYGENFNNGDIVIANNGEPQAGDGKLRTEFISSQQLNAWLPEELWRHHQLSFRLVTQTSRGTCAVEELEEE